MASGYQYEEGRVGDARNSSSEIMSEGILGFFVTMMCKA